MLYPFLIDVFIWKTIGKKHLDNSVKLHFCYFGIVYELLLIPLGRILGQEMEKR